MMVFWTRWLLPVVLLVYVVCIVSSKHEHKKDEHKESKIHENAHVQKKHHVKKVHQERINPTSAKRHHLKKAHVEKVHHVEVAKPHHGKTVHIVKHHVNKVHRENTSHHSNKTHEKKLHVAKHEIPNGWALGNENVEIVKYRDSFYYNIRQHGKHKLSLKHHKYQDDLHLKAHKKGVTYAESPEEPKPCIDFLPCIQYRYYHCRSHEWIRKNCPKLCLYCEHEAYPEPTYGRFKTVAASYPDWCRDDPQCVTFPTEACATKEWMQLHCLRKCDICFDDKKVKAGILYVGHPFDVTPQDKNDEEQLNNILQYRPQTKLEKQRAENTKLAADKATTNNVVNPTTQKLGPKPVADATAKPVVQEKPEQVFPVVKPIEQVKPEPIQSQGKPEQVVPVVKPVEQVKPEPIQSQGNPEPVVSVAKPVSVVPISTEKPVQQQPSLPANSASPVVEQQSLAAGTVGNEAPAGNRKRPIGVPAYSYEDLKKQELDAAKDVPNTKHFKAELLKDVQIKLKNGNFLPKINTANVFVKHEVSKPKRKHVVESISAPKHEVVKPKQKDADQKKDVGKHGEHLAKKVKKIAKKKKVAKVSHHAKQHKEVSLHAKHHKEVSHHAKLDREVSHDAKHHTKISHKVKHHKKGKH